MTCYKEIQFLEYLDGEMDQKNKNQLENHIQTCKTCKQILEYLKTEQHLIKDVLDKNEKSIDILPVFQERFNNNRFFSFLSPKRFPWLWAAAGIFLLAIGLSQLLRFQKTGRPVGETEIIVFNTKIEQQEAESFIYDSGNPDIKYIWFEKEPTEQ